ncbi:Hypothetical_protein [Hexamita inflata]|uniref:Hypothetical_protein n=1 Tax=Hexamita inflata TaxID=28002 RepID=A0AA86UTG1_9EUKA|nr:Hypothetical protein HINF_LOCUS58620 [Hexamita inflata]
MLVGCILLVDFVSDLSRIIAMYDKTTTQIICKINCNKIQFPDMYASEILVLKYPMLKPTLTEFIIANGGIMLINARNNLGIRSTNHPMAITGSKKNSDVNTPKRELQFSIVSQKFYKISHIRETQKLDNKSVGIQTSKDVIVQNLAPNMTPIINNIKYYANISKPVKKFQVMCQFIFESPANAITSFLPSILAFANWKKQLYGAQITKLKLIDTIKVNYCNIPNIDDDSQAANGIAIIVMYTNLFEICM